MNDLYAVDPAGCRARQQRLQTAMHELKLDWVVLTRMESIQWLTGARVGPLFDPMAAMNADGQVTLVLPNRKKEMPATANIVHGYEAKWLSTMRNDQRAASSAVLLESLPIDELQAGRVGIEFTTCPHQITQAIGSNLVDIEPTLLQLRRKKHADELFMMARANEANQAMYDHAREIVKPGINELDVYAELHATAVRTLGESLTYLGQDFQCNSRGGPPRNREAQAGELYILDLGVGFRGFYSDNSRVIAVDGNPTPKQQEAHQRLTDVFPIIEATVRPGVSCQAMFHQIEKLLKPCDPWLFNHHLGHGVGLSPHEGPHLNPHWDDTFEPGDFFTVEPGLYHDELRHGLRLEQNYLVTETGVELLTDWSLEM